MKVTVNRKGSNGYNSNERKNYRALPPQKVSKKVKYGKFWGPDSVNSVIGMAQGGGEKGRSPKANKRANYDVINSRFRTEDFKHVLDPYGLKDAKFQGSHTKMQNYNIIRQPFESLKGEEMKMGLNFHAVAVNGEVVSKKRIERTQAVKEAVKARAMAIANEDYDEEGNPNAEDPAEVANRFKTEYSHPTEVASNQLLKYLVKHDMLPMKFSKGWEHALITAEEIYYKSIVDGHPSIRVVNPLNFEFDREMDNPFIHKGDWAVEERWMPVGSLIDLYGDEMSDDLIKRLDNGELGGNSFMNNGMQQGFAYEFDGGMRMDSGLTSNTSHVYVANVCWRSYKKIGTLKYLDERTQQMQETIVDEGFRMPPDLKESGAQITWQWITEIWEGTRIGMNDFIGIRPLENQTGNLPYIGYVYNNVNSVATSLIDMVKAHQYTYIITWYRLEQEIAKAKGKKFIMDIAQLPKSKGWTVDQWMYYFDNLGVAWINSMEEGREGDSNSISKFNQFNAIDMSLSQVVQQYMLILSKLEEQIERITGVNRQRAGDIGSSETATGAQRAIIQSTNNTKPLYFYHDLTKEVVLQEMMELCKVAYADGVEIEHIVDENTVESIKLDAGVLNTTDLGVFITSSFEEKAQKEKLESFLEVALQTDKARLRDVVSVLGSNSISEIRDTLVAGEREMEARVAEREQQANETQVKINQDNIAAAEAVAEREDARADRDNQTKIEVALIKAESDALKLTDPGDDSLEQRKQAHIESIQKEEISLKKKAQVETERTNKAKEAIAKMKPSKPQNNK